MGRCDCMYSLFFFFKQNTAYEMRISDWSSDVCSSDLGPNGALPHYKVDATTNRAIEAGTLYLVDSGGQYADGTTDITRTIAIGTPTPEMRRRFTQVLKGHIALEIGRAHV